MEDGDNGRGWLFWLVVIPVALAAGALLTRWAVRGAADAPPAQVAQSPAAQAEPPARTPAPAAAESAPYDLPGDEPDGGEAGVVWGGKPAAGAQGGREAASAQPQAAADPKEAKKSFGLGLAYGALTKASEKLLNNPKAVAALLNNEYVVKGFMSRDTVKQATATSASLANYLKNPANLSQFMAKAPVQRGMNDRALVGAVASSGLAAAMLDTPGGKALLKDPAAIGAILQANPDIIPLLTNPVMLEALMNNPKTSGIVGQITAARIGR